MALVMECLQYSIYPFFVFVQIFHVIGGQSVGTPTSPTVCNGDIGTLTCDITQSSPAVPIWRVFTASDTSGSPVTTLNRGENSPPYNYPMIQAGDTVARLEVNTSSSIDGYHFQCRLDLVTPVDSPGTGTITLTEPPSCVTSFSANRDGDFTSATVTYQLANPPPGTSTTVTYCPTSEPNCGNNVTCTTSPCTISGLVPCVNYSFTATPNNNCGSPTGCNGSSVMSAGQDEPSCPSNVQAVDVSKINCTVMLTLQLPSGTPPVTSINVTYCPTLPPDCGNSMNCTNPCIIDGLKNGTEYQFTTIPSNICGSPTGCMGNTATATTRGSCIPPPPTSPPPVAAIAGGVVGGLAGVAIGFLATYAIAVLIAVLCCASCKGRGYCHVFFCQYCCGGESKRPSSTRPMPADEYADPKKIQYAALEFSEQAGSSGEKPIRSKEEPVQYLAVEQA